MRMNRFHLISGIFVLVSFLLLVITLHGSDLEIMTRKIQTASGPKSYRLIFDKFYASLGYKISHTFHPDFLQLMKEECDCTKSFQEIVSTKIERKSPKFFDLDSETQEKFLLNGLINLVANDRLSTDLVDSKSGNESIDFELMHHALQLFNVKAKKGFIRTYSDSLWLIRFFEEFNPLKLLILANDRSFNATRDKFRNTSKIDVLNLKKQLDYWHLFVESYDFGINAHQIDHVGLGLNDELDPYGDLKEIEKIACFLKKDGLLFLTINLGMDTLIWPDYRVYGQVRWPLLAANFEIVTALSHGEKNFIRIENLFKNSSSTESVVVLKKIRHSCVH